MSLTRGRALAAIAGAPFALSAAAAAQTSATVRIGSVVSDLGLETYISVDNGFYTRAGVNVEVTNFTNSGPIVQAVAGGALDAGPADMIQVANAAQHGVPLAFFAGGGLYSSKAPILGMCVAKNSPLKTAKDLEGLTIALGALKSITEGAVSEWLRVNGVDLSKTKFFLLSFPEMLPALQRGTISAALIGEPFLSAARGEVNVIGYPYDVVGSSFYISSWFASRDWLARDPDTARRFIQATYETARYANAHRADTALTLVKYAKLDIERVRAMSRSAYATSLDAKLMQPALDIAARYKLIERPMTATDLIMRLPA